MLVAAYHIPAARVGQLMESRSACLNYLLCRNFKSVFFLSSVLFSMR
jgi:hypothetical protein